MKEYLIVDGYNVIFAWPELKALSRESLEHARIELQRLLQNYGKFKGYDEVILVFDGKTTGKGGTEEHITKDFFLVFTGEGTTADSFIEKAVYERAGRFVTIYVVTSDGAEQNQVLGSGGLRIPVQELRASILQEKKEERFYYEENNRRPMVRNDLGSLVKDERVAQVLEKMRHDED